MLLVKLENWHGGICMGMAMPIDILDTDALWKDTDHIRNINWQNESMKAEK